MNPTPEIASAVRIAPKPSPVVFDDLTIAYDRHPIVHHLSGRFEAGSLTAIVGPNGAGKSTLLKAIAGLLPAHSGQLRLADATRRNLAYLPQAAEVDRSFPLAVIEVVDFGHWRRVGAFGGIDRIGRTRSEAAIAAVGLAGLEDALIGHLSMGQLQRVLFARLIVQDAALILLDEPFNGVDARTTEQLLALIASWNAEGRTVIAALHDLEQARRAFPATLLLARELVAWGRSAEVLSPDNLQRAAQLASAWNDPADICRVVA